MWEVPLYGFQNMSNFWYTKSDKKKYTWFSSAWFDSLIYEREKCTQLAEVSYFNWFAGLSAENWMNRLYFLPCLSSSENLLVWYLVDESFPQGHTTEKRWMILSVFNNQNKVPFHCVGLVPCLCQQWFQWLVKCLGAGCQLHFKVISSARATGVIPSHLTVLLVPGTWYPGREKYQHGTALKQPGIPRQKESWHSCLPSSHLFGEMMPCINTALALV